VLEWRDSRHRYCFDATVNLGLLNGSGKAPECFPGFFGALRCNGYSDSVGRVLCEECFGVSPEICVADCVSVFVLRRHGPCVDHDAADDWDVVRYPCEAGVSPAELGFSGGVGNSLCVHGRGWMAGVEFSGVAGTHCGASYFRWTTRAELFCGLRCFSLASHGRGRAVIVVLWMFILSFVVRTWSFSRVSAYLSIPYLLWASIAAALNFSIWQKNDPMNESVKTQNIPGAAENADARRAEFAAVATRVAGSLDSQGFPASAEWRGAVPLRFSTDWQGNNPDAQRETEVRLLWTPETLFVEFRANYRTITVFDDSEPSGRRDKLWGRDVAEIFLQPPGSDTWHYKEFEVSPNGMWIDLAITRGALEDLKSGVRRRVEIDFAKQVWTAELAVPMKSLVAAFDPAATWRVNFFRVEGAAEPRFYSAWSPTKTPQPNFHVPAAFGYLTFAEK
jgi:hypothetical protein